VLVTQVIQYLYITMCTYYVSKYSKGKYILLIEIFDKHGHIGIVYIIYVSN